MSFDYSSAPIVRLAWEKHLGLAADSLVMGGEQRITHQNNSRVIFLRLWEQSVLCAPESIIRAAAAISDDELSDHATMLSLTRVLGGRGLGTQTLYFADDLTLRQPADSLLVSLGNPEAVQLSSLCPPDDVNEVNLAAMEHKFTSLLGDEGQESPVATSAYAEMGGLMANIVTLVAPDFRRQGVGTLATSIAAHEALASGMIATICADVNNHGAHALATGLDFSVSGLLTSVAI